MTSSIWPQAALLILVGCAVYLPSLRASFTWDDDTHLTANLITRPGGLFKSWFSTAQPNYWPISWSSFWILWHTAGATPWVYHLVNVLVHGIIGVLAWLVARRLGLKAAFAGALLFVLHPVNIETVAWITQLKSLLAMAFAAGSLLLFLASRENHRTLQLSASVLLFLLSMLSKPALVAFPFVLLGLIFYKDGSISRRDLLRTLPFFGVSLALGLTELWFQAHRSIQHVAIERGGLLSRIPQAGIALYYYLKTLLIPYPLPFVPRLPDSRILGWCIVAGAALMTGMLWFSHSRLGRGGVVAWILYVLTLLPVLGFIDIHFMRYSLVSDHWQYQSTPFLLFAAVETAYRYVTSRGTGAEPRWKAAFAGLLLMYAVLDYARLPAWRNEESLWRDTLSRNPNAWLAWNSLGLLKQNAGELDEAKRMFENTLRISAENPEALNNLGQNYQQRGYHEEALKYLRRAVEKDPFNSVALMNMGTSEEATGQKREAESAYRRSMETSPDFAHPVNNLAKLYLSENRTVEAEAEFRRAIELDPELAPAHSNLGVVLGMRGDKQGAMVEARKAVQLAPNEPMFHFLYGMALENLDKRQEAAVAYQETLRLNPDDADALQRLQGLSRSGENQ